MSSRIYPLFVKGNPQLRVFLPNFWMKLVKHEKPLPQNEVKFIVSLQMTKYDVKNYLEKIYNVPVVDVRTVVKRGKIRRATGKVYLVKDDDYRVAFVTLTQNFEFPDLFPESKIKEDMESVKKQAQTLEETKKQHQRHDPNRTDVPSFFGL
uniref:Large ribosomal subunit protein uL23m n=1 Tax=Ornithodoros turicata TaxID=34597 RepID=A0A2R5LGF2_9ACAR